MNNSILSRANGVSYRYIQIVAAAAVVVPVEDTPGGEGGGLRARVRGAADTGRPPGHLLAERWPAAAPRQHLAQLRGRPHRLHAGRGPRSHHPDISQSGDHLQPPAGGGGGGAAGARRLGGAVKIPLKLVRTFLLQVAVTQTTSRAATRDTHLRQVRVFSPVVTRTGSSAELASFTSQEIKQNIFLS